MRARIAHIGHLYASQVKEDSWKMDHKNMTEGKKLFLTDTVKTWSAKMRHTMVYKNMGAKDVQHQKRVVGY